MNIPAIRAIFNFEMTRAFRTPVQTLLAPTVSTLLFVVVFGAAADAGGWQQPNYGTFVLPGALILLVLTQTVANAAFGIFFPKFLGTIFEVLAAPLGATEIVAGYVGAAVVKSLLLAAITLALATVLQPVSIEHPLVTLGLLALVSIVFGLLGFLIGIWARRVEKLQTVPMIVLTPLTFMGGAFYDVDTLPGTWPAISHLNPVTHIVSAFRWSFQGGPTSHLLPGLQVLLLMLVVLFIVTTRVFQTGYRLHQ